MVSIDFAYAQARAQARLGDRLPEDGWRLIESSVGLPQYLASVRSTALAPRVRHFTATITPHSIERTLREDWRAEVAAVARWVPDKWRAAVEWTGWLPYLDAVAWLMRDGPVLRWMRDDPMLAELAVDDLDARRTLLDASPLGTVDPEHGDDTWPEQWLAHWRSLWPRTSRDEDQGLQQLIDIIRDDLDATAREAMSLGDRREARARLLHKATRMMRGRIQQPAVVFCHLLIVARDLQRLRDGLMRRTLFNSTQAGQAA